MDPVVPYCGPAPLPVTLLSSWNLSPFAIALTLAPLLALLVARGTRPSGPIAASLALGIAFVSPLCALTVALFSARGLHHLVLILAAAPALAFAWQLPNAVTRYAGFIGVSLFLWLWHVPAVYALAWDSTAFYWAMQIGMLACAWAFWSYVLAPDEGGGVLAVGQLLGLSGQMGLIGAILTFSPRVLYVQHVTLAPAFGLDALTDQQLAGLIMWVPGMLPLAILGLLMLNRGLRRLAAAP